MDDVHIAWFFAKNIAPNFNINLVEKKTANFLLNWTSDSSSTSRTSDG